MGEKRRLCCHCGIRRSRPQVTNGPSESKRRGIGREPELPLNLLPRAPFQTSLQDCSRHNVTTVQHFSEHDGSLDLLYVSTLHPKVSKMFCRSQKTWFRSAGGTNSPQIGTEQIPTHLADVWTGVNVLAQRVRNARSNFFKQRHGNSRITKNAFAIRDRLWRDLLSDSEHRGINRTAEMINGVR